ncbi:MAG: ribose 5-phosphate isomerase B [Rhodothermia bacterium]|nr:ribose 5-phosphate isomerase B [Rhodothermia bacterium]
MGSRYVLTDSQVREAHRAGRNAIPLPPDAVVTPLARDTARQLGIEITTRLGDSSRTTRQSRPTETVAIGSDHGGFELKQLLVPFVVDLGFRIRDVGTDSEKSCDYPDFAYAVARTVASGEADAGIMIDGAGIGSAITCNKVPGIRAACAYNEFTAWNSRAHNNANVLTLGSRTLGIEVCKSIVAKFLSTGFEGGRHTRRVDKIADVEKTFLKTS